MSALITVVINADDMQGLTRLSAAMQDKTKLHERIAGDVLFFVKKFGADKSTREHRTATNLGARPTGHLAEAYQGIEAEHDASAARLLVPRASRLRAAFSSYAITPGAGKKYLTIPVNAESYGKRAGEMGDLTFLRVGPRQTAILARKDEQGNLETMYVLVKAVNIKEDDSLLPFPQIAGEAADSAEAYFDELVEQELA